MKTLLALVLALSYTMPSQADILEGSTAYKLSYTVHDNEKTRTFGRVICKAKGVSSEDYDIHTEDCDSDGLCHAEVRLNSKFRYNCSVKANDKSYFLGVFRTKDGAIVLDEKDQNENVVLFKIENK